MLQIQCRVHIACQTGDKDSYEFLVIQRSDDQIIYPQVWQVVTGWIERDEKSIEAARREVFEETGLAPIKIWTLPFIAHYFDPHRDFISSAPVFGFLVDSASTVVLSNEHKAYQWLSYDGCLKKLELPAHKQATQIFMDYVLNSEDTSRFLFE